MQKRLSRFSRRSIAVAIVGLAFAAAAGVGLAQIAAEPSATGAAADTTAIQSTTSSGHENDFADNEDEDGGLEFKKADTQSTSTSGQATTMGQQTTTTSEHGNGQQKVDVCHVTGNGKSHTINIAEPAVAAHVAHGDTEGACATTTTTTASTTATTSTHTKKPKKLHTSSHLRPTHTPHGNSGQKSHGKSGSRHGGGHGNGHGKK